jgi:hypothetical protein
MDYMELSDYIITTQEIGCDRCDENKILYGVESMDAAERFYNLGWRIFDDGINEPNILCPDCCLEKNIK